MNKGRDRQDRREMRDGQGGHERQGGRRRRVGQVCLIARARAAARGSVAVVLAIASLSISIRAADNARQIVVEAQKRTDVKSQRYEGLLQVFDAKGKISDKRWTMERIGAHGQSKAVLRFTVPAEVKGVALLVVNHPDRASDQWMWTPAIERDRRIALQDRSTRFFGTDFSFEDLEERDVNQYDYELSGQEPIDGVACWKITSMPRESKSSQYTRSIVWVRQDNYAFARIENYVKDQVVRRLNYTNIQNVQGIWTAKQLEMTDVRRGSRTRLTLDKLEYNVPLKDEDFTLQAIRRQ
jgi:outer membrane lipoprotein-sorting protein